MIAGFMTFNELKLVTGFTDAQLSKLIREGLEADYITMEDGTSNRYYKSALFNVKQVEEWIRLHIY